MRLFVVLHTGGALLIYVFIGRNCSWCPSFGNIFIMKLGSNIIPFSFPTYSFKLTHYSNTVLQQHGPFQFCSIFVSNGNNLYTRITIYDLVLLPYSFLFYNTNWLKFINKSKMIHLQAFAKKCAELFILWKITNCM